MRLELHQLDEKYADLRIQEATRDQRLAASMAEHGQQTPVVVTGGAQGRFILLDGYARVRALRGMARDEVEAVSLEMPEAEALVLSHRLDNTRTCTALEEGWLLRILVDEHGVRQCDLAGKLDRSESWVSRRLGLVRMLPASAQEAVQRGRIAAQAAQKWLLPLSRGNRDHCIKLIDNLGRRGASVRELGRIYEAWRRADPARRARIVAEPLLFLQAEAAMREAEDAAPERAIGTSTLTADLRGLAGQCLRLSRRLDDEGIPVPKNWRERRALCGAWAAARAAFAALSAHLDEEDTDHAGSRDEDCDLEAAAGGEQGEGDRADAPDLAQRGEGGAAQRRGQRAGAGPGGAAHAAHGAVPTTP